MDGVVSPQTAIELGRLGGLGVLNLEGIFTRYEKADRELEKISKLTKEQATSGMQKIYDRPVDPELIASRIKEIKAAGALAAGPLTPQKVGDPYEAAREAAGGAVLDPGAAPTA